MYRDSRRLRLVLALLVVTSFTLITLDYRGGEGTALAGLRRGLNAVFGPVQRAVTSGVRPIGSALSSVGELGSLRDDVRELREENADLKDDLRQVDDVRRANVELERLLGISAANQLTVVSARVVGRTPTNFEWTVTLDVGSRDGIRKDMTVLNGDGLVGRVLEVGPYTSQVLLACDTESTVAARLARTGDLGPVRGNGLKPMTLQVSLQAKPEVDDVVVSSGEGTFVPRIPIGVVREVAADRVSQTKTLVVVPYVRFTALDVVAVIVAAPRVAARPSVRPTMTATPTATATPSAGASSGADQPDGVATDGTGGAGPSPSPTPSGG